MKAVVIEEPGKPWVLQDRAMPTPGPRDLLVQVQASGLCTMDQRQVNGEMGDRDRVPGHEFVGEVVATGSEVSGYQPGVLVGVTWHQRWCRTCPDCARGRLELCRAADETGIYCDGGHAQYALVDADSAVPVPDGLDPAEAAVLMCSGYVAYSALVDVAAPGDRVAVVGLGGIGHLAVQYAVAMGTEVTVVTRTEAKAQDARALGAHHVVVAAPDDFGARLKAAGWVDAAVLTTDHPAALGETVFGLAPYGRVAVLPAPIDPVPLVLQRLLHFKLTVRGSSQGPRDRLARLLALHQRAGARAWVQRYPLTEINAAFADVTAGRVRYRAVLVPDAD